MENHQIGFSSKIEDLQDRNRYRLNWAIKNNLKVPGKNILIFGPYTVRLYLAQNQVGIFR